MKRFTFCLISAVVGAIALIGLPLITAAEASSCTRSAPTPSTQATRTGTIVDVAASNSDFSTLVTAVQAAGLVDVLSGRGPFTVFAPTNEAFAALPAGTLERLLQPENREALRKILTYHVVSGSLPSQRLQPGQVATVEGSPVDVQVSNGRVRVNDANVLSADVQASNGVIHVIDRVILPPDL